MGASESLVLTPKDVSYKCDVGGTLGKMGQKREKGRFLVL